MGDIVYLILIACGCLISYRVGRSRGHDAGYDEGWKRRERYGNGGRKQWWNRTPTRVKGQSRGYWRSPFDWP